MYDSEEGSVLLFDGPDMAAPGTGAEATTGGSLLLEALASWLSEGNDQTRKPVHARIFHIHLLTPFHFLFSKYCFLLQQVHAVTFLFLILYFHSYFPFSINY